MSEYIKRFIDCYVPTEVCNFNCKYCYLGQKGKRKGEINPISHSPEEVTAALSRKRWGGRVFLNFCAAGETLLGDDLLPIIKALVVEGHIVQIVTNGSITKRFEEISKWDIELLDRLFIKFSYHYMELKRLNLTDVFFNNIKLVQSAGASISLEITPDDSIIPYMDEIQEEATYHLGALPHVTVARNENTSKFEILSDLDKNEYQKVWGTFDSPMFDLKMRLLSEKRTEYCYGGEKTFYLDLKIGNLKQCYRGEIIDNIYDNPGADINFKAIGRCCPEEYCYNGHAWLTLGTIPELDVPTYKDMRDRKCTDGSFWLKPGIQELFSQKIL